jgi:hypothetical protein
VEIRLGFPNFQAEWESPAGAGGGGRTPTMPARISHRIGGNGAPPMQSRRACRNAAMTSKRTVCELQVKALRAAWDRSVTRVSSGRRASQPVAECSRSGPRGRRHPSAHKVFPQAGIKGNASYAGRGKSIRRLNIHTVGLVGAVGIEPTTFGLKGRCSAAELRPCGTVFTSYTEWRVSSKSIREIALLSRKSGREPALRPGLAAPAPCSAIRRRSARAATL